MKRIAIVIYLVFSFLLSCIDPGAIVNPYDEAYVGDYKFEFNRDSIPNTMAMLVEYQLKFTGGKDEFLQIAPSDNFKGLIDTLNFWKKGEWCCSVIPIGNSVVEPYSVEYTLNAITPNNRVWTHSDTTVIVNPCSLNSSEFVYGEDAKVLMSIDPAYASLYDSSYLVILNQNNSMLCSLTLYDTTTFKCTDSGTVNFWAVLQDSYGNQSDTMRLEKQTVQYYPSINAPRTVKQREGTVPVVISYSDPNNSVDSLFWIIRRKLYKRKAVQRVDTIDFTQKGAGVGFMVSWVQDETKLSSRKCTTRVTTFIPDTTKPTIEISDSTIFNVLPSNSQVIAVKAKDDYGVTSVTMVTKDNSFAGVRVNDSIWSATVTGIPKNLPYAIKASAVDSFSNKSEINFNVYHDPSVLDNTPPSITQTAGKRDGERITIDVDTMRFEIKDVNGIDSVYYTINSVYVSHADKLTDNIYQIYLKLSQFGSNKIEIIAIDGSYNKIKGSKIIHLNYNTIPNEISEISPADASIGIEYSNGVVVSWAGGEDIDGDALSYEVVYGKSPENMENKISNDEKKVTLLGLKDNTKYLWYVNIKTALDSIRCPENSSVFYSFTTKDIDAPSIEQISGPIDGAYEENKVVTMGFKIKDPNGLDSVYFYLDSTYYGDATQVTDTLYNITFTMKNFGSNRVTIHAIDASTEKNKSEKTISIIYCSKPTPIVIMNPLDKAINIENLGVIQFLWHSSTDADGDAISYRLNCGKEPANLLSIEIVDTFFFLPNFEGNQKYLWSVDVMAGRDTITCPSATSYYTFTTKDHPAKILNFNDFSCTINDSKSITIDASDDEGIKEFQWDFNGDGVNDNTTTTGTAKFASPSVAGSYNFIVSVIDKKDCVTKDTARIQVTNAAPVIEPFKDTLFVGYNDVINLSATVQDDGTITKYEWKIENVFRPVSSGDTSFASPTAGLPIEKNYVFRATDEDGNSSLDTQFVLIDWKRQKHPYSGEIYDRVGQEVFTHNGWIYLHGGWKRELGGSARELKKDLYRTIDGKTWELVCDNPPWDAASNTYSFCSNGTNIGMLGGKGAKAYLSSTEGRTWEICENSLDSLGSYPKHQIYGDYMKGAALVRFRDKCRIYGGKDVDGKNTNFEYEWPITKNGGYHYVVNPVEPTFSPRSYMAIICIDNAIYMIGGDGGKKEVLLIGKETLWAWKPVTVNAEFPPFTQGYIIYYNEVMFLFSSQFEKPWYSKNLGLNWQEIGVQFPFSQEEVYGAVVLNEKLWVATNAGLWEVEDTP